MKKTAIIFLLLAVTALVQAQTNLSSVFIDIPNDFLIGVSAEQKRELVSDSDTARVAVRSIINEEIERIAISDDYIALKTSDAGTLQVKLLPLVNDTEILGVITTVCGSACDSRIDFYTTSWQPLAQTDLFPLKDKKWFLDKNADINSDEARNALAALDMTLVKYTFSADNKDIIAEYDMKSYLSDEDYKKLEPYLTKEPKVFKWDKLSYKE